MFKSIFFLATYFMIFASLFGAEGVLILTHSYNRPDFIEIQVETFNKFLKDDYTFVVFNDASSKSMSEEIHRTCERLGVTCVDIPQEIHGRPYLPRVPGENYDATSVRNSNVVQFSLDHLGFQYDGIVAIFDSDLFLVREFSIRDFLGQSPLAGLSQSRGKINYLWPGLIFLDFSQLPDKETINFNCGRIEGTAVDSGGYVYYYLRDHPDVFIRYFNNISWPFVSCEECDAANILPCIHKREILRKWGLDDQQIDYVYDGMDNSEFLERGVFFHYRGGTNWNFKSDDYHRKKTEALHRYINEILKVGQKFIAN